MIDYLAVLALESQAFSAAIKSGEPTAPVPSCPDWNLADLAWHLTEVQHFWGEIAEALLTDPDAAQALERPDDDGRLRDLFNDRSARLLRALTDRAPGDECWSWHAGGHSIGWLRRRQAHEALIHRVDAEQAVGEVGAIEAELGADGVDEMLASQVDGPVPDWAAVKLDGVTARLEATDTGDTWGLAFGRFQGTSPVTNNTYDMDTLTVVADAGRPDVVIGAPAGELDLYMWGRDDGRSLTVSGDQDILERLRAITTEAAS